MTIQEAIGYWRTAEMREENQEMVLAIRRTIRSLELELSTGKPRCVRHLGVVVDCPRRSNR